MVSYGNFPRTNLDRNSPRKNPYGNCIFQGMAVYQGAWGKSGTIGYWASLISFGLVMGTPSRTEFIAKFMLRAGSEKASLPMQTMVIRGQRCKTNHKSHPIPGVMT